MSIFAGARRQYLQSTAYGASLRLFVKTREYLILPKGYFAHRNEETR